MSIGKACQECDKLFTARNSRIKIGMGKFCSNSCYIKYMHKTKWKRVTINCKTCNKEISPKKSAMNRSKNHFCCHKCYWEWRKKTIGKGENSPLWKERILRRCSECKKEFKIKPSQQKYKKQQFCSLLCFWTYKRKNTIKINCCVCGKEVTDKPSHIKKGRKCCSMECTRKWNKGRFTKENSPLWKGGKVKKNCEECGKEFWITQVKIRDGFGRFCSRLCSSNHRRFFYDGDTLGWEEGIRNIVRRTRTSANFTEWRQQCLIRDDFTCQKCRIRGGEDLHVHHKRSLTRLVEEAKRYLPLLSPDDALLCYSPLWDLENGITLCGKCHRKSHPKAWWVKQERSRHV